MYERKFRVVESFDDKELFDETNDQKHLKSITEILSMSYNSQGEQSLNILMKGNEGPRFLQLFLTEMLYAGQTHRVATFSDITESKALAKAEQKNNLMSLLTSSVSHEMLTPLKCICSFASSLEKELKHSPKRQEAEMIFITAKLLLSQTKMILDKNMIEKGLFTPAYEDTPFNRIVNDVVLILRP